MKRLYLKIIIIITNKRNILQLAVVSILQLCFRCLERYWPKRQAKGNWSGSDTTELHIPRKTTNWKQTQIPMTASSLKDISGKQRAQRFPSKWPSGHRKQNKRLAESGQTMTVTIIYDRRSDFERSVINNWFSESLERTSWSDQKVRADSKKNNSIYVISNEVLKMLFESLEHSCRLLNAFSQFD